MPRMGSQLLRTRTCSQRFRGFEHRVDDVRIAATAADVAAHRVADRTPDTARNRCVAFEAQCASLLSISQWSVNAIFKAVRGIYSPSPGQQASPRCFIQLNCSHNWRPTSVNADSMRRRLSMTRSVATPDSGHCSGPAIGSGTLLRLSMRSYRQGSPEIGRQMVVTCGGVDLLHLKERDDVITDYCLRNLRAVIGCPRRSIA